MRGRKKKIVDVGDALEPYEMDHRKFNRYRRRHQGFRSTVRDYSDRVVFTYYTFIKEVDGKAVNIFDGKGALRWLKEIIGNQ